jgi:hypothetical protein
VEVVVFQEFSPAELEDVCVDITLFQFLAKLVSAALSLGKCTGFSDSNELACLRELEAVERKYVVDLLPTTFKEGLRTDVACWLKCVVNEVEDAIASLASVLAVDEGVVQSLPFGVGGIYIRDARLTKGVPNLRAGKPTIRPTQCLSQTLQLASCEWWYRL